jgi:hypothetical protein
MTDRAELHQTFDDWGRDVRRKVADLKAQGIALKPVIFDAEGLVGLLSGQEHPCGGEARALFAAENRIRRRCDMALPAIIPTAAV